MDIKSSSLDYIKNFVDMFYLKWENCFSAYFSTMKITTDELLMDPDQDN